MLKYNKIKSYEIGNIDFNKLKNYESYDIKHLR